MECPDPTMRPCPAWNRHPYLPMSAEVEKAIGYITEIIDTYDRLDGYISATNAVSLARSALAAIKDKS